MSQNDALQAAIGGEHAAIYALGVAGGRLRGAQYVAAGQLETAHRGRRDRLVELLAAADQSPAAAAPAYDLPAAVTTAAGAAALVRLVEQRLTAVYGDLVESAESGKVRSLAIQALVATAREQAVWGGAPAAFPGAL